MKGKITHIVISILIGGLVGASFALGLFSGLESFLEDRLFAVKPVSPEIVIVAIDSESINKIGQWPWPREIFAKAFDALAKNPPKAVGLDVVLAEPSRYGAGDDALLAKSLSRASYPIVLPIEASPLILDSAKGQRAGNALKTLSLFTSAPNVSLGHVNLILDSDGVVRKFPPEISFSETGVREKIKAFSYEIAARSAAKISREEELLPIERIVFSAPSGSIRRIPFYRLLEKDSEIDIKGKIVLIGATAPDLHDSKPTPLGRGTEMPGVEIQANILNMLVSGYRLAPLDKATEIIWIFLAAFLPALIFIVFARSLKPLFANLFVGVGHTIASLILFERGSAANILHINLSWILATIALFSYRYFSGEKERREMKNLFSKYVSGTVLEEILREPGKVTLGGEEKEITVFFSDIRGFTTLSEKTTPRELVEVLNRYFTAMSEEILRNGGVLDKYIGDAIMAFWGAPIDDPEQADNALKAASGMVGKLDELNRELKAKWDVEINIGVGIYTGSAVVGNIGSTQRFDYTVIGDTVNVASRLEGLNKEYKTRIIIGEPTKNRIKGEYKFRTLGSVAVKGRAEELNIFTVEGYN